MYIRYQLYLLLVTHPINLKMFQGNKYMLINIANTPKYKFIEEETVRISKELGFKQEKTIELTLSSVMGAGYKYEPIFVFKKN